MMHPDISYALKNLDNMGVPFKDDSCQFLVGLSEKPRKSMHEDTLGFLFNLNEIAESLMLISSPVLLSIIVNSSFGDHSMRWVYADDFGLVISHWYRSNIELLMKIENGERVYENYSWPKPNYDSFLEEKDFVTTFHTTPQLLKYFSERPEILEKLNHLDLVYNEGDSYFSID